MYEKFFYTASYESAYYQLDSEQFINKIVILTVMFQSRSGCYRLISVMAFSLPFCRTKICLSRSTDSLY